MSARRFGPPRLQLGPIVGHTDQQSVRIWIRAFDDPAEYTLRIQGAGTYPFSSTEAGPLEFKTAVAIAQGLQPDRNYRYHVLRRTRVVAGSAGSFRTMPPPGSLGEVTFIALSCSDQVAEGAWGMLEQFVADSPPRFLLLLGDQIYMDSATQAEPNPWDTHLDSPPAERRRAMAAKYQESWSRPTLRQLMAHFPTYMIWDDHEVRDGWGSLAPDSPTLAAQFPAGRHIFQQYNNYFEDARDVYWHFQMCRNPPPYTNATLDPTPPEVGQMGSAPSKGARVAMPFVFRCGRTAVVVADMRGARDLWRESRPVLGADQWSFLEQVLGQLAADIDALVVATPVPLTAADPDGLSQAILGHRTDDVALFKKGDAAGLAEFMGTSGEEFLDYAGALINSKTGGDLGTFRLKAIDDVRDQWSHAWSRPEQAALIQAAVAARSTNRISASPRALLLLGGDLHVAALFEVMMTKEEITVPSLVTSGVSQKIESSTPVIGTALDEEFEVSSGIQAKLSLVVNDFNFGLIQVVPMGAGAVIVPSLIHPGASSALGGDVWVGAP